jgi:hypothetical protein
MIFAHEELFLKEIRVPDSRRTTLLTDEPPLRLPNSSPIVNCVVNDAIFRDLLESTYRYPQSFTIRVAIVAEVACL